MWDKLMQNLPKYPTAVLTGLDSDGYPFSVRCKPQADNAQQVLHVQLPPDTRIQAGKAGLLCHYHNDQLWDLSSFTLRGTLEQNGTEWIFRPQQFYDGEAKGFGLLRFVLKSRRDAAAYLKKRGLSRPQIPWGELDKLKK